MDWKEWLEGDSQYKAKARQVEEEHRKLLKWMQQNSFSSPSMEILEKMGSFGEVSIPYLMRYFNYQYEDAIETIGGILVKIGEPSIKYLIAVLEDIDSCVDPKLLEELENCKKLKDGKTWNCNLFRIFEHIEGQENGALFEIRETLRSIGSEAAPPLIPLLEREIYSKCKDCIIDVIIGVGDRDVIPLLRSKVTNENEGWSSFYQYAIDTIEKRQIVMEIILKRIEIKDTKMVSVKEIEAEAKEQGINVESFDRCIKLISSNNRNLYLSKGYVKYSKR